MTNRPDPHAWFRVLEVEPGVFLLEEPWHEEAVKSYLIVGRARAVLLDTGTGLADLRSLVGQLTDRPVTVVQSHAHWDHIGGAADFADVAPILIHAAAAAELRAGVDATRMRRYLAPATLSGPFAAYASPDDLTIRGVEPTEFLIDGQRIDLGDRLLEVIETPGHTVGHVSLWDSTRRALYATDAAYAGPLYAQMADSNLDNYLETLNRLAALATDLDAVYPAHGPSPIAPALLPAMRDAMAAVIGGRSAERHMAGTDEHQFGAFSILVAAPGRG